MVLAALAVNWITTEEWSEQTQQSLQNSYTVVQAGDDASTSSLLGASLLNGLVIIAVIGGITFVVVALLHFRCMKVLYGYLIITFLLLFGILSSEMFRVAIEAYSLHRVDTISYWMTVYNFSVVGTISVFWSKGTIPRWITQAYLIASSVLVAWQLSQFDPWTAWTLLILLSLYDLFAVLTPWGPLKALMNVLQKEGAPSMPPGLLFEARVHTDNSNTQRASSSSSRAQTESRRAPQNSVTATASTPEGSRMEREYDSTAINSPAKSEAIVEVEQESRDLHPSDTNIEPFPIQEWEDAKQNDEPAPRDEEQIASSFDDRSRWMSNKPQAQPVDGQELTLTDSMKLRQGEDVKSNGDETDEVLEVATRDPVPSPLQESRQEQTPSAPELVSPGQIITRVPLAIARLYKLRLADNPNPVWRQSRSRQKSNSPDNEADDEVPTSSTTSAFTVEELQALVDAIVPQNGGRIDPHPKQNPGKEIRYKVTDRHGTLRRILFVGERDGRIYQDESHEQEGRERRHDPRHDRIRLGLGDFVFYSVLVALASMQSFVSFAACFNVILMGLCATLLVLAIAKHALPALPISILAAVVAFALTQLLVEDWIHDVHLNWTYV